MQILNLQISDLFSLTNLPGLVGNKHDFEIRSHEIFMSFIHVDLCHQVHWCGDHQGLIMLCVINDSRGGPDINYEVNHIVKKFFNYK